MFQVKLHGIRNQAGMNLDDVEAPEPSDPLEAMALRTNLTRTQSAKAPPVKHESVWKRRHSITASKRNTDWADLYLSTAATDSQMAGFLSIKDNSSLDAEYFVNFIPKAVLHQDALYKELLAVYNALKYWTSRNILNEKKVLLAIHHPVAAEILKQGTVHGNVGPQKVLLLHDIDELTQKQDMELRVAEVIGPVEDTVAYVLAHSDNPTYKRRFQLLLAEQTQLKGEPFVAKEQLFPPVYK